MHQGSSSRRSAAVRAIGEGSLSLVSKLQLGAEVMRAYVPLLREMRRNDLPAMVAKARATPREARTLDTAAELQEAFRLSWMVRTILGKQVTEKRCLIQALVLVRLLERRGLDNRLVIGVRGEGLGAHAWVEHRGEAVLPPRGFERLAEF